MKKKEKEKELQATTIYSPASKSASQPASLPGKQARSVSTQVRSTKSNLEQPLPLSWGRSAMRIAMAAAAMIPEEDQEEEQY